MLGPYLSYPMRHAGILTFERKKKWNLKHNWFYGFFFGYSAIVVVTESFRVLCDYTKILSLAF